MDADWQFQRVRFLSFFEVLILSGLHHNMQATDHTAGEVHIILTEHSNGESCLTNEARSLKHGECGTSLELWLTEGDVLRANPVRLQLKHL